MTETLTQFDVLPRKAHSTWEPGDFLYERPTGYREDQQWVRAMFEFERLTPCVEFGTHDADCEGDGWMNWAPGDPIL